MKKTAVSSNNRKHPSLNKKWQNKVDERGIEPMTYRMRSDRSTPELHAQPDASWEE
jgi:hypothetical protein